MVAAASHSAPAVIAVAAVTAVTVRASRPAERNPSLGGVPAAPLFDGIASVMAAVSADLDTKSGARERSFDRATLEVSPDRRSGYEGLCSRTRFRPALF